MEIFRFNILPLAEVEKREDFKKEIAITQRLVESSVRIINRCASEFGINHEN